MKHEVNIFLYVDNRPKYEYYFYIEKLQMEETMKALMRFFTLLKEFFCECFEMFCEAEEKREFLSPQ